MQSTQFCKNVKYRMLTSKTNFKETITISKTSEPNNTRNANNIKINDSVTWINPNTLLNDRTMKGIVKNIVGDVAIVKNKNNGELYKLLLSEVTLDNTVLLNIDDYHECVEKIISGIICDNANDLEELISIANTLFEELERELFEKERR